jgi:ethanolamine ammonia-lyase large subunit
MLAVLVWSVQGQVLVEASKVPEALRNLEPVGSSGELKCRVQPFKPSLNYSFRFQTGYVLELPLALYTGKGHSVITLVRVTPRTASVNQPISGAARISGTFHLPNKSRRLAVGMSSGRENIA